MNIVGIQESFIDYPNEISLMVFTPYCTWDCVDCHNKYNLQCRPILSRSFVENYLVDSRSLVSHLVISGGEPTLESGLFDFVKYVGSLGYKIKLDTNGTHPEVLTLVLPYLSVVAMDIKEDITDYNKYKRVCRTITETEFDNIKSSLSILSDWSLNPDNTLILRTTLFDDLIDTNNIKQNLAQYHYDQYIIQPKRTIQSRKD